MKVKSNGIGINVEEKGSGDPALVFLHYYGGSSRTWKYVTAPLSRSYRTIAIDHRGWGESDSPVEGYSLTDHANDAAGVIDALHLRQYVLVGHSMGGKVAQLLASRQPKGLVGLILVGSSMPTPLVVSAEMRERMRTAYSTRENVEASIDQVLTAKPLNSEDREQVIADSLRGAPPAKEAWPAYSSQEDISDAVSSISVPTLVIAAELDRVDSVETTKSELLSRIPGAVLQIVHGTGHLSPLESPNDVVGLIEQLVSGLLLQAPRNSDVTGRFVSTDPRRI
jgi:pimeloyl-ACP methyl ester carboxylesterase